MDWAKGRGGRCTCPPSFPLSIFLTHKQEIRPLPFHFFPSFCFPPPFTHFRHPSRPQLTVLRIRHPHHTRSGPVGHRNSRGLAAPLVVWWADCHVRSACLAGAGSVSSTVPRHHQWRKGVQTSPPKWRREKLCMSLISPFHAALIHIRTTTNYGSYSWNSSTNEPPRPPKNQRSPDTSSDASTVLPLWHWATCPGMPWPSAHSS